jgi:Arc/MetJ family transcription regulator
MRTTIVINDQLMRETLRATGLRTKREAVEAGLRTLLRLSRQGGRDPQAARQAEVAEGSRRGEDRLIAVNVPEARPPHPTVHARAASRLSGKCGG